MTAHRSAAEEAPSPPTPDGVPLLGNGLAFSRNPVEAMEQAPMGHTTDYPIGPGAQGSASWQLLDRYIPLIGERICRCLVLQSATRRCFKPLFAIRSIR